MSMPFSARLTVGTIPQYAHKRAVWADGVSVLLWNLLHMDEDELSTDSDTEDQTTQQLEQKTQLPRKRRKFGHAPSLEAYRSHNVDISGQPYQNTVGKHYYGSICDTCEEEGYSFYHHPLRCHRQHPGWRERNGAPEQNGMTSWHVRGLGTETLNGASSLFVNTSVRNE